MRVFCAMMMALAVALTWGCGPGAMDPSAEGGVDVFVQGLDSGDTMLPGTMPHFWEFDYAQNPNAYYWCGHTAFKIVYQYKTGVVKTLPQIDILLTAHYGNYSKCARKCTDEFQLLGIAQDLGMANSAIRTVTNVDEFFAKMRDGVNFNFPPIVGSYWNYPSAGHYWVVVGYRDTGKMSTNKLYLRNVAQQYPDATHPSYDMEVLVQNFYHSQKSDGTWYNANTPLFIKP